MMPELLLPVYPDTLLHQSRQAVIQAQQAHGERMGAPWGVSESGYYAFDRGMAYQYRAFGLSETSLRGDGPAPCVVPKINYHFRYCLTLRCRADKALRGLIAHILRQFAQDKANRGVSAFVDVNGMD